MKRLKILSLVSSFVFALTFINFNAEADKSIGSTIGGMIDCPSAGKPCSSDADSSQSERCKVTVGIGWSGPYVECSE